MDSLFSSSNSPNCDPDDAGIAPSCPGSGGDLKSTHLSSASSSPKRSRRCVQKRVVTVPIADTDGSRPKGGGEGAPPSDSWAWRKYGQKPIKGSPYPRGYYRCSSSKGCPARKQVERSRVDPTVLVVTYSGEHNHPWPRLKNQSQPPSASNSKPSPSQSAEEYPAAGINFSPSDPADPDDKFSDLIGEERGLMMSDDYHWFTDVGSPSSASPPSAADDFLLGPIACSADVAMTFPVGCDEMGVGEEEGEDSLFAGLGELPECSVVFRRGFFERQMLVQGEESRQCGLAASR